MSYNNIEAIVPEDLYNKLNRGSREYDGLVTDIYYFIINGGKVDSSQFDNLMNMALDAYYNYATLKDNVSNTVVIPAVRTAYDIDPSSIITNNWNIEFDGSKICKITDINVVTETEQIIHESECEECWINDIANINTRIAILNEVFAKINSTIVTYAPGKQSISDLRNLRTDLMELEGHNKARFMDEKISKLIEDHDPAKCTWKIEPTTKRFYITERM